jgi:hypothetical protein
MRVKAVKGNNALRLCEYILDPMKQLEDGGRPILYTNMSGRHAVELAQEFQFSHELNPRVENGVCHYCVSMPAGEKVERPTIVAASKRLLELAGHAKCQYFITQHHDREHQNGVQHWHIATSAIALDGRWVDDGFIRKRLRNIEQQIERELGLRQTTIRPPKLRHNLTTGEYRLKERSGKVLPKEKLWQIIQSAAEGKPTMTEFVEQLQRGGASVQLYGLEQGKARGISYGVDGVAFPGGKLGPAYSLNGVQEHLGVSYEPERDNQGIQQLLSHPLPAEPKPESELVMANQGHQGAPNTDEIMSQVNEVIARIRKRRIKMQTTAQTIPQTTPPKSQQTDQQTDQQPTESAPETAPDAQEAKAKPKQDIDWEL